MLASLAALHLLVATQVSGPPRPVTPEEAQAQAAEPPAPGPDAAPPAPSPAPPPAEAPAPAPPPAAQPAPGTSTPPAAQPAPATPAPPAAPQRPRLPSLLSAEPLRGASAAFAWAGWSSLGAAYEVGVSEFDDLGGFLDHDWAKSELLLGLTWRRSIASSEGFDFAGRLSGSWYTNFGTTWIYSDNHSDRGLRLAPALVMSRRAGDGVLALSAEGPMTVTWKYESGFLFEPKATISYEAPLYPGVTVGARFGAGYRAGAGGAPLRTGRGELEFLVLAGWQIL